MKHDGAPPTTIMVYNRATGLIEPEIVLGERLVRLLYENPAGRFLGRLLFTRRFFLPPRNAVV